MFKRIWNWIIGLFKKTEKKIRIFFNPYNNFSEWKEIEKAIFNFLNDIRAAYNLPLFVPDRELYNEAIERNLWQFEQEKLTHDNIGEPTYNLKAKGFNEVKELLGVSYYNQDTLTEGWMKSESHKDAILNKDYKYIGIAQNIKVDGKKFYCAFLAN
jgi:uncharacterized protein YkwD